MQHCRSHLNNLAVGTGDTKLCVTHIGNARAHCKTLMTSVKTEAIGSATYNITEGTGATIISMAETITAKLVCRPERMPLNTAKKLLANTKC